MDKIKGADDHLAEHPDDQQWLIEVHPEVSFLELNERRPLPGPKASAAGLLRGLELVIHAFPDAREQIDLLEHAAAVSLIDIFDAYAAAWSALRWRFEARGLRVLGDKQRPPKGSR